MSCPSDCLDAPVTSYNLQSICDEVDELVMPSSAEGVATAIREANAKSQRVRVVGRKHTANAQICGDGLLISTEGMSSALRIERFRGIETVVTQTGIRYGDLTDWLDARGRSLGYAVLGTRDPTIGGAIATGSHGSSWRHDAVISNLVEELTLVDANGDIQTYNRYDTKPLLWKTMTASLGLAGVITEVRLRVQESFNLDVKIIAHPDDGLRDGHGPQSYVADCDYGQLNWFPGQGAVIKTCGIETDLPRETGATNRLLTPDFSKWIAGPAERALQYGMCRPGFNCSVLESFRFRKLMEDSPFAVQAHPQAPLRGKTHVVGAGNRMMSSEFTKLQTGMLQYDFEFAVPAQLAPQVFAEAHRYFNEEGLCFPLVGIFIRFSPVGDESWIAHTSSSALYETGEPVVFFEMPVYVPVGVPPDVAAEHLGPYYRWIERLVTEFNVRPHWGKNDDWVFDLQDPKKAYGPRWDAFNRAITELDPSGRFSNSWLEARGFRGSSPEAAGTHPHHESPQ